MEKKPVNKKKIINIVVNVIVGIICLFILLFAVMAITNTASGYNKIFGYTILSVETGSMEGDNPDSFSEGDLIFVKLLSGDERAKLEKDQVITFWWMKDGNLELNTHRIIHVTENQTTGAVNYVTKGDANTAQDGNEVVPEDIVGVYTGKWKSVGKVLDFMQGKTGFLIFVVIPAILLAGYCIVIFILNLKGYNKLKQDETNEDLKKKLLAELQASGQIPADVVIGTPENETLETTELRAETPPKDNPSNTDTVGD